jgi:hypothetical protein
MRGIPPVIYKNCEMCVFLDFDRNEYDRPGCICSNPLSPYFEINETCNLGISEEELKEHYIATGKLVRK